MTPEYFDQICDSTEFFLSKRRAPLAWFALPLFLPISEHPAHTVPYAPAHDRVREMSLGICVKIAVRDFLKRILSRGKNTYTLRKFSRSISGERYSTIMFSWLVNKSHIPREMDFYLGNMQSVLKKKNRSSLLILGNASDTKILELESILQDSASGARRMMPEYLGFWLELKITLYALWGSLVLVFTKADGLRENFRQRGLRELLLGYCLQALRFHEFFKFLLKKSGANMIITLYEGYPWERCLWYAGNKVSKSILKIGYQHAIVREKAFSMKRIIGDKREFAPDLLLTTGEFPAAVLSKGTGIPCRVYGSARNRTSIRYHDVNLPRRVLVIPEGIVTECEFLIGYVLASAHLYPDIEFIIRLHPSMPAEQIHGILPDKPGDFPNVSMSGSADIEDDFKRCGFVLFRGSNAIANAIARGLRLIYLSVQDEISIDPLGELKDFKTVVTHPEDLALAFAAEVNESEWQRALEYCEKTYAPVDDAVLASTCDEISNG